MRNVYTYFWPLLITVMSCFCFPAQGQISADSLVNRLSASRSDQTLVIPDDFIFIWPRLGKDIQDKVERQIASIMNKRYGGRSVLNAYFQSIAYAKDVEYTSDQLLTSYLNVADKVIERHPKEEITKFFKTSSQFFEHQALFYSRAKKLYALDDTYQFEYVEEIPPVEEPALIEEEPIESDERFEDWDEEDPDENWDTEWEDDFPPEDEDTGPSEEELLAEAITGGNALPEIQGPIIKFTSLDLNFVSEYDSVFLENTAGTYILLSNDFVGSGGRFNWTMAGLSADSVYCDLSDYSLKVNKVSLSAEATKLTYIGRLDQPIAGVFEYKSVRHDSTTDASYPRFQSYYSNIPVRGFDEHFLYRGGFSLKGGRINSSSLLGKESLIEVQDATARKFRARAAIFEFQDSTVRAKRAAVVIYQGNDSIYHPALRLKYDMGSKYLVLQKDKGGFRNTPYTATYFNIDFTSDIVRWDLTSDSLDASILEARRIVPAYFESSDHYTYDDYHSLGDKVYDFNPLGIVAYYASRKKVDEFYVSDLAKFYKKDERLLSGAMVFLAQKGLIGYDSNDGLVTVKQKTTHLFNSKNGKKDFDNIIISSVTHEKPNATLNFREGALTVRGVESFRISDSLNVVIEPDSSEIKLLRNRDFKFNGKVYAGNFEYVGRDFTFKYDSFLIYLNTIDSIEFFVDDINSRGSSGKRKVQNALVSADSLQASGMASNSLKSGSGTLYINKPNNKSSKVKYLNYPRFNSEKGQVAYFDRKEVLGGVYDKSLYFLVPPFDLDSLGGSDPAAIGFEGTFGSSGMFPDFKETMRIQPDFSLGFQHEIPPEGYTLYEGEGKLFNKLSLDSRGLRGDGRIDFLTTSLESSDFIFYPDSVTGSGNYFEMREAEYNGVIFPQANLSNYEMKWLPKKDSMYIKNVEDPIQFYNQSASLDGTAIVTNNGVFGSGVLATRGSESKSKNITLEHDQFSARHAQFELQSSNPDKPALYGDDVRLKFDLDENYAVISPEIEGEAAIEFPYAQFKTSITRARWDLEDQKITMIKPDDVPLESSYFYTTREDLDSLRFNAAKAEYDINTLELKVSGIPYIIVADAKITPENNEVLILENSKIGQLTNTTIILDTLNGYHRLTEGVIDIKSRNEFSGYATYQFVNTMNDTIPIKMENFHLEEVAEGQGRRQTFTQHTVANGSVSEIESLVVSPAMYYKGDLILYAHKPAMELAGYVKLDLNEPGYNTWIQHSSSGDQREVMIDFNNATTEDGRRLEAGLHFSVGDNSLYHSFVTEKYSPDDEDFFTPSGVLFYDKEKNEFVIEDTVKAAGKAFAGQIFRYNQNTGEVKLEGKANFIPPNKDVNVMASVIGNANINELKYNLNTLFSISFKPVPSQAFDVMALDILDVVNNLGAPEGLGDPTQLLYKLADIAGERAAQEYERQSSQEYISLGGFTKETTTSMLFANVDMKWSSDYNAFYSEGKLGMSNIQRTDINGAFDGFLEVKRNEDDGSVLFNLFLKASADSWYYFSYEDNRLLIFSSNNAFNTIIGKKSNGAKAKIGDLVFAPGDRAETLNFINRFRLQYYGIEEPYQLDSDIEEEVDEETDDTSDDDDGFDDDDDGF